MSDEDDIIESVRQGSTDAFEELVLRHQRRVFAILGRYERDVQRVEDLAQQVFVKAWRAIGRYDGRAPFEHWVSRIAVRTALDHLRKRKRLQNEVLFTSLGDSALEWLRGGRHDPSADIAREILEAGLCRLAPEDRMVITLLELDMRSVAEISKLTGWSAVGVRVRAYRARKRLRGVLERIGHG